VNCTVTVSALTYDGKAEKRQLFDDDAAPRRIRSKRHALQWPDIEQQQQHRKRDDHRLGHRRRCEERDRQPVPASTPLFRIRAVRKYGQQQQERAQHVLALGDPRDRFDVSRMDGEHRPDERAPADRAGGVNEP
jgi:hypothetical protein